MRSLSHYRHQLPRLRLATFSSPRYHSSLSFSCSVHRLKLNSLAVKRARRRRLPRKLFFQIKAFDAFDGDFDVSPLDDWGGTNGAADYILSSSDGEDSDPDFILNPISDIDLPTSKVQTDDSLTMTVHRLGLIGRGHKKRRIKYGTLNNVGLVIFLVVLLSYVDWCAWKIVRLPLAPFYLSRPFFISAALAAFLGYLCVPFLNDLKLLEVTRKRSVKHFIKRATPTMGGLFFVPIGVGVARVIAGFSSIEVSGAAAATLAFSAIGFLDDVLTFVRHDSRGLSAWLKILLQVAVGTCFSFWLDSASISTPYSMKFLVPLPPPLGLVFLGKFYLFLTSFSFVSIGNGVHLTDTLDGLAGGAAALAFVGVSIAVLPICSELAIFGASMAGACVGFLLHNRYKASVFMGGTGSLALGGALTAMAACSGMFFPLFISSGIFLFEASSVIIQVLYFNITKCFGGAGRRLFRMAPFHHHLLLCGLSEPVIVIGAYVICGLLALLAGYVGLVSA